MHAYKAQLHTQIHIRHAEMYIQICSYPQDIHSYPWNTLLRIYLDKPPSPQETHLNIPMVHTHMPNTSLWVILWSRTYATLRTSLLSQFSNGHNRALAPSGGSLSVCSGSSFLYPWNQASEGSELRNKMDTQDGMCYSSLFKANKIYNWALRCWANKQMEKNGEDKLALISAESLSLLLHPQFT